jgi:tRNA threonylcarbamoyl adenosine modification protein YeaZ
MMKILAINNTFTPIQIVFGEDNDIFFSVKENPPAKYPNNILYIINAFFTAFHLKPSDIEGIAIVNGPGSFTGTRIGVVEAKIMAYFLSIPLVTINSLDLIGAAIKDGLAVLPAGRGQIFAAQYKNGKRISIDQCIFPEDIDENIPAFSTKSRMIEKLSMKNILFVNPSNTTLFKIALEKFKKGEIVKDPLSVSPIYLRSADLIFRKKKK